MFLGVMDLNVLRSLAEDGQSLKTKVGYLLLRHTHPSPISVPFSTC